MRSSKFIGSNIFACQQVFVKGRASNLYEITGVIYFVGELVLYLDPINARVSRQTNYFLEENPIL